MNKSHFHRSKAFPWIYAMSLVVVGYVAIAIWRAFVIVPIESGAEPESTSVSELKSGRLERPKAPRNDFVGSATCAECHPKIAESYRSHSMANSLWEAASAPEIEDYADRNTFSPDGRHSYSVEKTSEGVFHHERLSDGEGGILYDQSVRVDYAMGSGHQGRSYLIDREGKLFMSPITWYSHAARWDLSPQYKLPIHRRFGRRIVDGCLNCHAGRVNSVRGTNDLFGSPPFYELAIGCERCHGPGGEHSIRHRQGPVQRDLDPIVNPSKLEAAFREDICAQCHLQGEGSYPRFGCEIGDFRPGQRLEETCVIFVAGTRTTPEGTTRAVSQVEQMRASRCFQASDGRFGCTSCHDPHSRPQKSEIDSFYRQKCLACHDNRSCRLPEADRIASQADDSCIACHMQKLGANDVPHTSQTDHRVLRKPTAHDLPGGLPGPPEFYDNSETRLPRLVVEYARGLWLAERAERRTDRDMAARAVLMLSNVLKELPDDVRILNALGTASTVRGQFDDALTYWKKSLAIDSDREQTLESVSILLQNSGRSGESRPYLERALELNPWKASRWGRYSQLLGQAGEWTEAITAAKKAEELDPSVPQNYRFLAEAYRQIGNLQESERYTEKFEKIRGVRK